MTYQKLIIVNIKAQDPTADLDLMQKIVILVAYKASMVWGDTICTAYGTNPGKSSFVFLSMIDMDQWHSVSTRVHAHTNVNVEYC